MDTGEDSGDKAAPPVIFRDKSLLGKQSRSEPTIEDPDNELKILSIFELNPADHIVISIGQKFCHAIVEAVDYFENKVDLIYYDDTQTQCSFDEILIVDSSSEAPTKSPSILSLVKSSSSINSNSCQKAGVKRSCIHVDLNKVDIHKIDYDLANEVCISTEQTLEKARKFIGKHRYNIFVNNDEHFAIYCKTGKAAKLFIIDPNDINSKNLIGTSLSSKITSQLAQQSGQILLVNTAKHIASKFPRTAVTAGLPAAAEAAGSMIGVGIESISMGYDIYQKHKELKEGKLTEMKFKKYIARRVTRGTMSVAGGIAGGVIGQMVIPIPVVGAVVGSLVGGVVGAVAGQGEGILIGELVELIDNKIKEKKAIGESKKKQLTSISEEIAPTETDEAQKEETKKENESKPDTETIEQVKYEVLHHLVFKFPRDLLKEENFAHLNDVKIELADSKDELSPENLLKNANEFINDEDYDIFIVKGTNEIVENSKLNVQDSIDNDGAVLKRKSLQAFTADQLPENLNLFFKIIDTDELDPKTS